LAPSHAASFTVLASPPSPSLPSHVQFSHHGVIGNRNALAHATASLDGPVSRDGGFAFTYKGGGGTRSTSIAFTPPSLVRRARPGQGAALSAWPQRGLALDRGLGGACVRPAPRRRARLPP
jgi:phenylpropionate dioxygenase-like ring-hydroxylating dioxygenase large terminal subunit